MMRMVLAGTVLAGCCALPCCAQYEGTPAAKGLDQKGHDAENNGKYSEALADYRKAIALDPNYTPAYQDEISVAGSAATQGMPGVDHPNDVQAVRRAEAVAKKAARRELSEFQKAARRHPDNPIYPWAVAQVYGERDAIPMERYCRKAIAMDAHFGPGYECLAGVAFLRGDEKQYAVLWQRAAELEPDNATAAFVYSRTLQDDDAAYKAATMDLVRKFPANPVAAQALYWYAGSLKTDAEKVEWLERLRRQFAPEKYLWSEIGMEELFRIEDSRDPARARTLADAMARLKPQGDDWAEYTGYADAMAKAGQELAQGHPAAAMAALKSVKAPYYGYDMRREVLLNARARDASAGPADAYAFLLREYADHPTDEVGAALEAYAARLGKNADEVHAAVWAAMQKSSQPAIPFTLPKPDGGKRVSLADYRGHVVLLDFWFPGCGPCRQSFPYLANLARKYKDKGVVVLAVNGEKGQRSFAVPYLRAHGYDFVPLQADMDWDADVYHVRFYPTTFVIGADGRQYFRPRLISDVEERAAELEIEELLAHSGG